MFEKAISSLREEMLPYFLHGEEDEEYATNGNYYEWYYTYARSRKPRRVLEIGVRLGYSAIAMLLGHPEIEELCLFDDGSYGFGLQAGVDNIRRLAPELRISAFELDTQRAHSLPVDGPFDLIHVDGDHTYHGAIHDLSLVLPLLAPGGWIVLDDVDHISRCKRAARAFHALHSDLRSVYNPTHRGHVLFERPIAGRSSVMKKTSKRNKKSTSRREFFRSAGRGTLVIGGVALFGAGATAAQMGCSSGEGGGGTNSYGGGGTGTGTGGTGAGGPGMR